MIKGQALRVKQNMWDDTAGFMSGAAFLGASGLTYMAGFMFPAAAAIAIGTGIATFVGVRVYDEVIGILHGIRELIGEKANQEHEDSGLFQDKKQIKEKLFEVIGNRRTQDAGPTGLQADIEELKRLLVELVGHEADEEHEATGLIADKEQIKAKLFEVIGSEQDEEHEARGLIRDKQEILNRILSIIGTPADEENAATGLNATLDKVNGLIEVDDVEEYEEGQEPASVRGVLEKVDVVAERLTGGAPLVFSLGGGQQQPQAQAQVGGGRKKQQRNKKK